jgi:hypothetical protein
MNEAVTDDIIRALKKERDYLRSELDKAMALIGASFHEEYSVRRAVLERDAWHGQARKSEERYAKVLLETNWRSIETAPRDGTKILLAKIVGHPDHDTALWWVARGSWSSKWKNWNDGVEPCGLAGPTHWLPVNAYGIPLSSLSEETV